MHQQSTRQLQERFTSLAPAAVLDWAVQFFSRQSGVYAAFPEKRGPTHVMLRGQGGEEIAIAAWATDAGTRVSGSSYMFDQQVVRFLDALPLAPAVAAIASVAVAPAVAAVTP